MDDLKGLSTENLNIRYLAWKENHDPASWAIALRKKTGILKDRAKDILLGKKPTSEERAIIAEAFDVSIDELSTPGIFGLPGQETLRENIKYLMTGFPQGERKLMAEKLKVTQATVSRWHKTGVTNSHRPPAIMKYLGVDPTIELEKIPLFLSTQPVGKYAQKRWVLKRLDSLTPSELSEMFPLLQKLFGYHEGR